MRLAFICSGLEPGRDGVGDYTRHLAAECVRQGHEVRLIALNDRAAAVSEKAETQDSGGIPIPCERYSSQCLWPSRFEAAQRAIKSFSPDCVCLQFVPYGFQPKGIPWFLARGLARVIGGRPLAIMFHELWIGFGEGAPWKQRLVGAIQRRCIFGLLRRLRPGAVFTSNVTYATLLRQGGVEAVELPIFSNIPVVAHPTLPSPLIREGISTDPGERRRWLVGLFFGTIHPEWRASDLMDPLLSFAAREKRRVCLVSAGRLGSAGELAWAQMRTDYEGRAHFLCLGELPAPEISDLMQTADFGVAVTPWRLMGKSGSAAAMIDHGLPVVFTRTEGAPDHDGPIFFRCGPGFGFPAGLARREPSARLGEICARFIASLPLRSR
ncbi:MAG: glycosyltransferase [Chthoniobacteraceae bacterium]